MRIPLYQVDAFAQRPFEGNPAAVCPLDAWPDDTLLQAIAMENNLSETAYLVAHDGSDADYDLRWFTPGAEVPLCGHATLASAWVVFERLVPQLESIRFQTLSGVLTVSRDGDTGRLAMDFPATPFEPGEPPHDLAEAVGAVPREVCFGVTAGRAIMAVFDSEAAISGLAPNLSALTRLTKGVIVTGPASGDNYDCASRFFAPHLGVPEDPVTGSAHCAIVPYWAKRLGKTDIVARQISPRGGTLFCTVRGERVVLRGTCAPVIEGTITLD